MIENNEFLEWQDVFGELYGITKNQFSKNKGYSFIILDVLGALRIKNLLEDDSILIFLKPPSKEVLRERLKMRNTESPEEIDKRLYRYEMEMDVSESFDYVVVNDDLEETIETIVDIIT